MNIKSFANKFRIGVVGLSSQCADEKKRNYIQSAIDFLQRSGFLVKVGTTVFAQAGERTASIAYRVKELEKFLKDPELNLILNTTGGYNSNELLEFIDYKSITNCQKLFVGYSDITAINLALYLKSGVPTINGPMLIDYKDHSDCFRDLFMFLEHRTAQKMLTPNEIWETQESRRKCEEIKSLSNKIKQARGKAIIANLSTFNLLCGTSYFPSCDDAVLFLEYDKEEQVSLPSIQRNLWQLKQAGVFNSLKGLCFGLLELSVLSEQTESLYLEKIIEEVVEDFDFPVLLNVPFGHVYPSAPIMNGAKVKIEEEEIYLFAR